MSWAGATHGTARTTAMMGRLGFISPGGIHSRVGAIRPVGGEGLVHKVLIALALLAALAFLPRLVTRLRRAP